MSSGGYFGDILSSFGTYFEVLGRRFFMFSVLLSERRGQAMIAVPMHLLGIGKHRLVFTTGIVAWHVYTNEEKPCSCD